jgi:hypothetical protein
MGGPASRECAPMPTIAAAADNAYRYRAKARECLSLAECMTDPEERAEIIRFAGMWMSLAEPIDEARGSYEFPYEFPRGGQPRR